MAARPDFISDAKATVANSKSDEEHNAPVDTAVVVAQGEEGSHPGDGQDNRWIAVKNRNVSRVLLFCFLDGGAYSIWSQQVFPVFVKQLSGDIAVGWMSAASGIAQMISAVIAGYVADRCLRQTVLRVGATGGLLAVVLSVCGVYKLNLVVLYVAQAAWGAYSGVTATGTEAIFADSVASGRRAFVYNLKWIDQTLSSCVGIIVTIVLLTMMGNQWQQAKLVVTMYAGLCLHPLAMLTLWTLRDKYALTEGTDDDDDDGGGGNATKPNEASSPLDLLASPTVTTTNKTSSTLDTEGTRTPVSAQDEELLSAWRCSGKAPAHAALVGTRAQSSVQKIAETTVSGAAGVAGCLSNAEAAPRGAADPKTMTESALAQQLTREHEVKREAYEAEQSTLTNPAARVLHSLRYHLSVLVTWEAVPYFVCLVDFLVAFGSGMTLRFMALFFIESYGTTPALFMTATLLICPLQAFFSWVVQYLGDYYIGRLPSTMLVRLAGTVLLLVMGTTHLPLVVLLPIYIVRNALMNSTRGVTRSVIMDAVKKENRAKWSAFESFSSFTWAGSATVGGYIAAARGYQYAFTITACFHFCAIAVLIPAAIGARAVDAALRRANWSKSSSQLNN